MGEGAAAGALEGLKGSRRQRRCALTEPRGCGYNKSWDRQEWCWRELQVALRVLQRVELEKRPKSLGEPRRS